MGVITEIDVDYGRIFGPFPAVGHIPPSHFIGLLTADERNESTNIKINLNDSGLGNTWLPYIQTAHTEDEQNVEAYTKDGHIYYRTLRIIKAGEQLYVWYSKDFAHILDIPNIKGSREVGDNTFLTCDFCGERFRYVFPLMAHTRFRCARQFQTTNPERSSDSIKYKEDTRSGIDRRSPEYHSKQNKTLKREFEVNEDDVPRKRLSLEMCEENNNVNVPNDLSPGSDRESDTREALSAFRKVEKTVGRSGDTGVEHFPDTPTNDHSVDKSMRGDLIGQPGYQKSAMNTQASSFDNRMSSGLGMLMSGWMVPRAAAGGQQLINPRLYADYINTSRGETASLLNHLNGISNDAIRGYRNNDILGKQVIMEQLRKSQYPRMQTTNPMVGKILTTTTPTLLQRPVQPLSLAQNWCAKCNATFRMTSDLVYHMRSHHKREFDPAKRKRDDKLQCHVCKETFKERHHLTRHMTSH